MWGMYHMDRSTSVHPNQKECHPKGDKKVKRKEIEKTKITNAISYVGNVAHEQ
jgi:hypothetical protein